MEDSIDGVFLNAVHEDGRLDQRTPFEVKMLNEFQQGAFDRGDVEDDRPFAPSINSRATYDPMKPAPPVMRVAMS